MVSVLLPRSRHPHHGLCTARCRHSAEGQKISDATERVHSLQWAAWLLQAPSASSIYRSWCKCGHSIFWGGMSIASCGVCCRFDPFSHLHRTRYYSRYVFVLTFVSVQLHATRYAPSGASASLHTAAGSGLGECVVTGITEPGECVPLFSLFVCSDVGLICALHSLHRHTRCSMQKKEAMAC